MTSPTYLSQDEFALRLGLETMIALFDDTNTRVPSTGAIAAVLQAASRRTTSVLATEYRGIMPFPVSAIPEMATELTYEYAMALAWPRNPDYLKALGIKLSDVLDRAEKLASDLRLAVKRMVDATPANPANVGGAVLSGNAKSPMLKDKFFLDGTGDF